MIIYKLIRMNIGDNVIYVGKEIKYLESGKIGVLTSIFGDKCTIVYPDVTIKDMKVSCHSAYLKDIKIVKSK